MFGGGGGSGPSYIVEVMGKEDVVGDGGLGQEHCLLFFNGGGEAVRGGGKFKFQE